MAGGGPQLLYNIAGLIRIKKLRLRDMKRDTLMINFLGASRMRGDYGSLSLEQLVTTVRADGLGPQLHVWGVIIRGRFCAWICASDVSDEAWQLFHDAAMKSLRDLASPLAATGKDSSGGPS
jgi:hypothetical protein